MRVHIENLAKIKNADIELSGITIIAGKNDTGKSTVGKALFCMVEAFHDYESKIANKRREAVIDALRFGPSFIREETKSYDVIAQMHTYDEIRNYLDEIIKLSDNKWLKQSSSIPDHIAKQVYEVISLADEDILHTLINTLFQNEYNQQPFPLFEKRGNASIILSDEHVRISVVEDDNEIKAIDIEECPYDIAYIDDSIFNERRYPMFSNRGRYYHSAIMRNKIYNEKRDIVEMAILNKKTEPINKKLSDIINGKIVKKKTNSEIMIQGLSELLKFDNLSMGLKSIVYLKILIDNGTIRENTIIVLDEPEIHLHPEWQIKLAEILVMLQNELNVTLLITTHSPYFINAIQVYSAKANLADRCKYYMSYLEEGYACFEDVTCNVDQIYQLLAEPLRKLSEMTYGNE